MNDEMLRFGEVAIRVKASAETTGGAFALFEENEPVDTPLHMHENEDELFYVLEGEHVFEVGDEEHRAALARPCSRRAACLTRSGAWSRGWGACSCSPPRPASRASSASSPAPSAPASWAPAPTPRPPSATGSAG